MKLNEIRNELSVRAKNGIGFLLSATVIWSIITIIFLLPVDIQQKNIFMLISTGIMFPLSIGMSAVIKADWQLKGNPLGNLGLIFNLAQLIYFPILFFGMITTPENAILFFAIITGAHLFPYGWFYHATSYYIMAPVIAIVTMILGLYLDGEHLWAIPLSVAILLLLLIIFLTIDYRKKQNKPVL
ncbi:hypothetical protein [Oceanobacillus sp. J11TS1]|uniref:DUF7010 family protein n=1 Tax=Oceanobacillus sp. J11TS1 TaxID=2807191 RepID=UPI001B290AC8|nr:hypothetical protein [Oceanobacillus sp. J11TS1]GIO21479.1 hypothetical protein J11TS1_00600 [Oceanobacillus sp. J11TS1]